VFLPQLHSTIDRKKIEDGAPIEKNMGTSGLYVGDFEDQFSHWSGLSYS